MENPWKAYAERTKERPPQELVVRTLHAIVEEAAHKNEIRKTGAASFLSEISATALTSPPLFYFHGKEATNSAEGRLRTISPISKTACCCGMSCRPPRRQLWRLPTGTRAVVHAVINLAMVKPLEY
jgi:hypothetical protein